MIEPYDHHLHGGLGLASHGERALSGFKRACYDLDYSSKRPLIKVQAFHLSPELLMYYVQTQPLFFDE